MLWSLFFRTLTSLPRSSLFQGLRKQSDSLSQALRSEGLSAHLSKGRKLLQEAGRTNYQGFGPALPLRRALGLHPAISSCQLRGSQLASPPRLNKNLAAGLGLLWHRLDCLSYGTIVALDDPGNRVLRIMDLGLLPSF